MTTTASTPPNDTNDTNDTKSRLAPWVAGAVLAAPILLLRYPPLSDLAMHEALVALMRHRGDPSWAPPGMYAVVAPQANQLFHFLALGLSYVVRTDTACKLVVAVAIMAAPVVAARSALRLGLSPWAGLLVAPIVCGWMFTWGLVANLIGFVLLLALLPLADAVARRPAPMTLATAIAASAALLFAHESTAVIFALLVADGSIVRCGLGAGLLRRSLPVVAVLAGAVLEWRASRGLAGANMSAIGNDYGDDPTLRLGILPGAIFGGRDTVRLAIMTAAWALALGAGAVARHRSGRARDRLPASIALWRYRHAVLAVVFFFLYLGFPMSLGGNTLLAHRFVPPACALLVLACAPRAPSRAFVALCSLSPILTVALLSSSYARAHRQARDLDALIARIPDGASVAQLDLTPIAPQRVAPVPGIASRAQAEHGGRMLFQLTDMPPNPLYMPRPLQWNEPLLRLGPSPYAFMPQHDGRRFAYLLVMNRSRTARPLVQKALAPEEELVASSGEWDLFRSTLPTVPIDAPDVPLPAPAPEMLVDRVNRLAASPPSP